MDGIAGGGGVSRGGGTGMGGADSTGRGGLLGTAAGPGPARASSMRSSISRRVSGPLLRM
jgi:hypothetical protein